MKVGRRRNRSIRRLHGCEGLRIETLHRRRERWQILANDPMGMEQSDVYILLKPQKEWRKGAS